MEVRRDRSHRRAGLVAGRSGGPGRPDPQGDRAVAGRTGDGLLPGVSREEGEYLAALAAGFHSLAVGAGPHLDCGEVRQTIVEPENGLFFVVPAGSGSCLALPSAADANAGLVAYEMTMLVKRMHEYLSTAPRPTAG